MLGGAANRTESVDSIPRGWARARGAKSGRVIPPKAIEAQEASRQLPCREMCKTPNAGQNGVSGYANQALACGIDIKFEKPDQAPKETIADSYRCNRRQQKFPSLRKTRASAWFCRHPPATIFQTAALEFAVRVSQHLGHGDAPPGHERQTSEHMSRAVAILVETMVMVQINCGRLRFLLALRRIYEPDNHWV
ncbi:hypothetical protein JB92DRAFT_2834708 [Gautieria morchelliformis]|nr:hypothetical protein JB92DRAFT_2834708 [Gautieria morchelliformis]